METEFAALTTKPEELTRIARRSFELRQELSFSGSNSPLPQNLADVDRRRRQEHAFGSSARTSNEVFFLVRFEQKRKLLP